MRFSIQCENNKFICINNSLNERELKYINDYIQKVNKYKVIAHYKDSPVYSIYQPPLSTKPGIRSLDFRLERKFKFKRIPASATISIAKNCQCSCEHCSAVYYNYSAHKILSNDLVKEALNQTVELGATMIILLGGEPLLRKEIFEQIESIPKDKACVILFTNGEFLTKENCANLKNAGLMGAFVSIDSELPEVHDRLRGRKGLFNKAINGIANLESKGIIPAISSYLSPKRLEEEGFQKMMELAKEIRAKEVTFFDAIPSGKWLQDESCILNLEDRIKIKELIREYRNKPEYPGMSVQSSMTSECGSAFCFAANTQFYLTAFGDMCPCDFTPMTIGKFPEQSIEQLWMKMLNTKPYNKRHKTCRMQNREFRDRYIKNIPAEGPFPFPLELLNETLLMQKGA